MRTLERIYLDFARLLPKGFRQNFQKQMVYAGLNMNADAFLGQVVMVSIIYGIIAFFAPLALFGGFRLDFAIGAALLFGISLFMSYMWVYFKVEDRTKKVESILPDTFQMIAANLRAGMTPYKALKSVAKGHPGPLADEIEYVTSHALGIESFGENLMKISERIKSDTLDKSMKLFTTSMRSGGRLATLLEELSVDMSETQALKNELKTSTKTYTAFIMFTVLFGAPLLLAISVNFVGMITNMQSKTLQSSTDFGMGGLMSTIPITQGFMMTISMSMLFFTSILASMLMGTINEGEPKSGLKYALGIMAACLVVFFIANIIVGKYVLGMA